MPRKIFACAIVVMLTLASTGCRDRADEQQVVVYTALDREFSEPILAEFERKTGIKALAKYDLEATKTVGLVGAIESEKDRPRCDVFWNNEIVHTIRLKNAGLLAKYKPAAAAGFPAEFKDPDGYWNGFAGRARVLLVNTNLVSPAGMPASIRDLADPRWKGKTGIAKPLFGTTASHAACLFAVLGEEDANTFFKSLKKNDIRIMSGNKSVALGVSAGTLAFGLTDTDDAILEVESGKPVTIVYPDSRPGRMGVLFIPNTLSLVKNSPNPEAGKQLIEYLLSPDVEIALSRSSSAQIPLNPEVTVETRVRKPAELETMAIDFNRAAALFSNAATYIADSFLE
jgi:iron(III) transport system substrate-binding protein